MQRSTATTSAPSSKCDDGTENSEQKQDQIDYVSLVRAPLTSVSEIVQTICDEHPGAVTAELALTAAVHAAVADRSSIQLVKHMQSSMAQSHREAIPSPTASANSSKCDDGTGNSGQKQDKIDYVSLFRALLTSDSESARAIFDDHPGAVTAQLAGKIVLRAAVADRSSIQLVKYLVDLMAPDSLNQPDALGRTALHVAAMAGNTEAANILVGKNPGLLHQTDRNGELPLHLAARHADKETVRCLLPVTDGDLEGAISGRNGVLLLRLLIFADFYDIALEVLNRLSALYTDSTFWVRYRNRKRRNPEDEEEEELRDEEKEEEKEELRDEEKEEELRDEEEEELRDEQRENLEKTLHVLATRPEAFARRHHRHRFCLSAPHHCLCNSEHHMKEPSQFAFFQKSTDRTVFEYPEAIDLLRSLTGEILKQEQESATYTLGRQLCAAAQFGNYEAVVEILRAHPSVLWYTVPPIYDHEKKPRAGHGFLQVAVINGQERVFNLLDQLGSLKHHLLRAHDIEGNNILHLAARRQPSSSSSAALQVQRDLQWFKEIEKSVPPTFRYQKNYAGKIPSEVFDEKHEELLKEGGEWMKKTAESCTVVAALVVTVVFAAAFTVPGGNNDSNGIPNYLTDASFMTFAISDTLGLVSSTTSLLMFLSLLSSRFSAGDLLNSRQYTRLSIGLVTLFFSLASMLVTFTASVHIVLGHRVKWIAVPIGIFASLPVILFASLQFRLLVEMVYWTFPPIFSGRKGESYTTFRPVFWGRKVRSCFRCCS